MASDRIERRLTAILSTDVVGYSRLMAADEEATLRAFAEWRDTWRDQVAEHRGRVVDVTGDNLLAEFPSALDATRCALAMQKALAARNDALPQERRMEFRIGIHLGDVMVEGERIQGDGVNIAARLEALAEARGLCISAAVHEQVRHKLDAPFEDLGERTLKNIPSPVRVYRLAAPGTRVRRRAKRSGRWWPRVLAGAAALLLLALAGLWASWPRPLALLITMTGSIAPPVHPPLPDKPSIVVLPFQNLGGDPGQEYFADGMTEDLTTELSRNEGLFVIARNSAFTYKGRAVKVDQVARELGVRYVLEGSVRREEDRVRVTAQLIDATRGFHLWSERYDRQLADIFALQAELAGKIQTALQVRIRDAEIERARRGETRNLDAHDAMMRGMHHFERARRDENQEARRWFQRAFELDPGYASAHAMYGLSHAVEYGQGWNRDPALLDVAETAARRAMMLEIRSADAANTLGYVHLMRRELDAALASYERAIALEPSHDIPHLGRGVILAAKGRLLPALESMRRAMRLNPVGHATQRMAVGFVNYRAGRTAEAVALMEQARAENPDLVIPRLLLIHHRDREGRPDEARTLVGEVRRVNPALTAEDANYMTMAFEATEVFRSAGLP